MPSDSGQNSSDGDSIKVYVRVRPPDNPDREFDHGQQCLEVRPPSSILMFSKPEPKVFTYDHVADIHTTQEGVFGAVGRKIIESCVAGYNGTIFAYGQTGSGKTFTMIGPNEDCDSFHHELRGVIPRSFEYLFNLISRERERHGENVEFLCKCSFLEIYNEQIYDLLDTASPGLHLREDIRKGVFVDGLIEQTVSSSNDAYQVLSAGWINRRVASTSMNRESSRSHAVFTLTIESKEKKAGVSNIRVSQLSLVDLAGSERQKDTNTHGARLKEAGSINRSLSALGNVIMALVDIAHGKTRHVPYRDSKLSFLLRDALGGNAKTYIIACVHPGIRCFGETLSTLHFANRAKMIKNKAKINEDTQGNIVHLQAEIKRLRDELNKFQSGVMDMPMQMPNGGELVPVAGNAARLERQWQKKFLDAMYFREKLETDQRGLVERISRLEEHCEKKDKFLQSSRMIIKFRENTIIQLEKVQKKELTYQDANATIIDNLKKEIQVLQEKINHHPGVTKYAMENQNLRAEIKRLQQLESVRSAAVYDEERILQLEKQYKELVNENEERPGNVSTPNSTPQAADKVSAATLERYKAQIQQLQKALESTKQELAEKEELARQKQVNLEAENASLNKTVSELEKVLEGVKVKNKMEMEAMKDMHAETIKTITTPKRAVYNLRNRKILVKSSGGHGSGDSPIPLSLSDNEGDECDEEGIDDVAMPIEMTDQRCEALTEEIKKFRERYNSMLEQLQEDESKSLKLKSEVCRLEIQNQQLNEMLQSSRSDWSTKEQELTNQVSKLTAELDELITEHDVVKGEVEDLRVLLNSADRQLDEEKQRKEKINVEHSEEKAALDAKVVRIEIEMFNLQKQLDEMREEKDQSQNDYQTSEMEKQLIEKHLQESRELLQKEKEQVKQLEQEMQLLLNKLEAETEKTTALEAQLKQEDKEKELLKALEDNSQLKAQNTDILSQCQQLRENLEKSQTEVEVLNTIVTTLQKRSAEDKEGMSKLMANIQELRSCVSNKDDRILNLGSELEDAISQCELSQISNKVLTDQTEALQNEIEKNAEMLQTQAAKHNMELDLLHDELEETIEQCQSLTKELHDQSELLQITQNERDANAKQISQLQGQVSKLEEELKSIQAEYENKLQEAEANTSTIVVETQNGELQNIIEEQREEIQQLKSDQAKMTSIFEEYENTRKEKNEEIQMLKSQLLEIDRVMAEKEVLATNFQMMKYDFEFLKDQGEEKEAELKQELESARTDLDKAKAAYYSANRIKDETIEEKIRLETELAQMRANMELQLENNKEIADELERTQLLEMAHFKEKEELRSSLEQEIEIKTKLSMEIKKLEEKCEEAAIENAKLITHQNLKQKIHYHLQIKKENTHLKEQLNKVKNECAKAKQELEHYRKTFNKTRNVGDTELKENLDPRPTIV
ncbi:kinesin-like protein KIF15 [Ptychodera flava]|uniref:kinesin-like protein KIF15 n=1 Tax=Ptychodera flava TaxID=63121 RepID=UPI00396A1678